MANSESTCPKHCRCSPVVAGFAYVALAYLGASLIYLVVVAILGLGTPFNDSLSEAQRYIKQRSARNRGLAFTFGVTTMVLLLLLLRPFPIG